MPGREGIGPMGEGAMTGRGLGICEADSSARRGAGRGMGSGRGLFCRRGSGRGSGRGFGRGFGRGAALNQTSSKARRNRNQSIDRQSDEL